jgi:GT2 family glycosyltransferase
MTVDRPDLSAIVIACDGMRFLPDCLRTLVDDLAGIGHEIVVVDNGSSDGSVEYVRNHFPDIRIVVNDTNLGFTRAVNIGVREARGDVLYVLNQDLRFRLGGAAALLERLRADESIGLIGPAYFGFEGGLQNSARSFPRYRHVVYDFLLLSRLFSRHREFSDWRMGWFDHRSERFVDQPMGAAMMLPRRVIESVGEFDEVFPIFFSDVDYCKRLSLAGYKRLYYPQAQVEHYVGGTTSAHPMQSAVRSYRSMYRYLKKYARPVEYPLLWACGILLGIGFLPHVLTKILSGCARSK